MIPQSRTHAVGEFELWLRGSSYESVPVYSQGPHAGACAKDQPSPPTNSGPVRRVVVGTVRFSRETGEVLDD